MYLGSCIYFFWFSEIANFFLVFHLLPLWFVFVFGLKTSFLLLLQNWMRRPVRRRWTFGLRARRRTRWRSDDWPASNTSRWCWTRRPGCRSPAMRRRWGIFDRDLYGMTMLTLCLVLWEWAYSIVVSPKAGNICRTPTCNKHSQGTVKASAERIVNFLLSYSVYKSTRSAFSKCSRHGGNRFSVRRIEAPHGPTM